MITKIYKKNHPVIPKDFINTFYLGFLGWEYKKIIQRKSSLPIRKEKKKRNQKANRREKGIQRRSLKEGY